MPPSSILYPDNGVRASVRLSVTDVRGTSGNNVLCTVPCEVSRHNVGQSANSEWCVASGLQPWSLSQQFDATKRHVPKNGPGIPVALVMQGIFP